MHAPVQTEQPKTTSPDEGPITEPIDYLSMKECRKDFIYAVHADEFKIAVYDGEGGFVGLPDGDQEGFLVYAKHADLADGFVYPMLEIEPLPQGVDSTLTLNHNQGCLWYMRYDRYIPVIRRKERTNDSPHGDRGGWVDLYLDTHVRIPHDKYPFMLGNEALIEALSEYERSA